MEGIKALAFDTGGTVLDWHSGIVGAFAEAGGRHGVDRDWHEIANDYRRRSLQRMLGCVNPGFNIDDVHREILDAMIAGHDLAMFSTEDRESIARRWHELDAWSDFSPALVRLRKRYTVVSFTILSVSLVVDVSRKNGLDWDCVISCEMLDVYKTQPASYQRVARLLALQPSAMLMVACHNFDLVAAKQQGYRTGFVRRPTEWGPAGPPDPVPHPTTDLVAADFSDLASQLGA
jgi:2-haloacid dehalogenase